MENSFNKKVVKILVDIKRMNPNIPFLNQENNRGHGTGFFIDNKGTILTCCHVVKDAINITIEIPGFNQILNASLIGLCDELDIALLKIDFKSKHYFKLGNSKNLKLGTSIYTLGYPATYSKETNLKINKGIISGTLGENLMIDAPINEGNSGGPLLLNNKVIGINIAFLKEKQNMNISVPIHLFQNLEKSFYESKIVYKPILPLCYNSSNEFFTNNNKNGVYIYDNMGLIDIPKNSILTKIDNYKIDNYGNINLKWFDNNISIQNYILQKQFGSKIKLEYFDLNLNKTKKMTYTLKPLKLNIRTIIYNQEKTDYLFLGGAVFQPLNLNIILEEEVYTIKFLDYFNLCNRNKSVVILTYIFSNSYFGKLDVFNPSNIITKINDIKIKSFKHFKSIIDKNKNNKIKLENELNQTIFIPMKEVLLQDKFIMKKINNIV